MRYRSYITLNKNEDSFYLEPELKPWNFVSLILPGTRLIIWTTPATLTYLITILLDHFSSHRNMRFVSKIMKILQCETNEG